jgi:hypothetical protein
MRLASIIFTFVIIHSPLAPSLICGIVLLGMLIAGYFLYPRTNFNVEVEGTRINEIYASNGVKISTLSDLYLYNPNYIPIDIRAGSFVEFIFSGETISTKEDNPVAPFQLKSRGTTELVSCSKHF